MKEKEHSSLPPGQGGSDAEVETLSAESLCGHCPLHKQTIYKVKLPVEGSISSSVGLGSEPREYLEICTNV